MINSNLGRRTPAKKSQPSSLAEAMMLDTEAAVMANLSFLSDNDVEMEDDDDMNDDGEIDTNVEMEDEVKQNKKGQLIIISLVYLNLHFLLWGGQFLQS